MDHFSSTRSTFDHAWFYHPHSADARPRVAVSACLAGERVRYDGASRYLPAFAWLAEQLHLVPICPEVGAGLEVPRPPVQLVAGNADTNPRALGRDDPTLDVTAALTAFARTSVADPNVTGQLCGYLLKSRSPSCGLDSTPLFAADGAQTGTTSGIQATYFQSRLPWLSYCEETRLVDREAALAFELRCRLVFDWLYAGDAAPIDLLRHYRRLFERLAPAQLASAGQPTADKTIYLAALQGGCAQLPPAQLLELFSDCTP
jgi:uncharacterized protein YbbK (DUF523 family)